MISYGAVDARIKPEVPAQPLCSLASAAASSSAVSVIEACPRQPDMRLTLLRLDEEDQPRPRRAVTRRPGRLQRPGDRRQRDHDRGLPPDAQPTVTVNDETGTTVASTLLPKPASPAGHHHPRRRPRHLVDR